MSSSPKPGDSTLRTVPSFDIFNTYDGSEVGLERSVTIGDKTDEMGRVDFTFGKVNMGLIEEEMEGEEGLSGVQDMGIGEEVEPPSPPMYLATGLGIGGGGDFFPASFGGSEDVEELYKRMVDGDPCNPLFLRNYAQLLESKGDLHGAEEYYLRATLADPINGEILLHYAKLVWGLHRDRDKALTYFERAAQAAPEDSHVLAAHASFLWETEDGDVEASAQEHHIQLEQGIDLVELKNSSPEGGKESLHFETSRGINGDGDGGVTRTYSSVAQPNDSSNIEEYHKRLVNENPSDSLILRNYAQFLSHSKGDNEGAEEYYLRAIIAEPRNGEIMSQYAEFVWQLHKDREKASRYFERAVHDAPGDSQVLAAYASFLWETEEDEEEGDAEEHPVQSKEDLREAKESTAADPCDAEILLQYAKLLWKLHHDLDRAATYFERAAQAASGDSNVLATYASFLWETEEDENVKSLIELKNSGSKEEKAPRHIDSISEDGDEGDNTEDYYQRMVEENPCSSFCLRNYAKFLFQNKRDLEGAEHYYLRAMKANPADGEIMAQYAVLVWELHKDQHKSSIYFEQAVQAAPRDRYRFVHSLFWHFHIGMFIGLSKTETKPNQLIWVPSVVRFEKWETK